MKCEKWCIKVLKRRSTGDPVNWIPEHIFDLLDGLEKLYEKDRSIWSIFAYILEQSG